MAKTIFLMSMVVGLMGSAAQVAPLQRVAASEDLGTRSCTKKRVDPCGCHRVFGIRHCHPQRKTVHCEAMV